MGDACLVLGSLSPLQLPPLHTRWWQWMSLAELISLSHQGVVQGSHRGSEAGPVARCVGSQPQKRVV